MVGYTMKSKRHRSPRPDNRKCVQLTSGTIIRETTDEAYVLVTSGRAVYIPKKVWKYAKVRGDI